MIMSDEFFTGFTDEQKNILKHEGWKKESNKIDAFVEKSEGVISHWVLSGRKNLSEYEELEQLKRLAKASREYLKILKSTHLGAMDGGINKLLLYFDSEFMDKDIDNYSAVALAVAFGIGDFDDKNPSLGSKLFFNLESSLRLVEKVANKCSYGIKPRTGPKNRDNEDLMYFLATYYLAIFRKLPSGSTNGSFYKFVRKSGEYIGITFTRSQINNGIERMRKNFNC